MAHMLINGLYFDHLDPDPGAISLDVLAAGMRAIRFNGQTTRTITIGEHSLRVARLAPRDAKLWALLHDAHEALVPWGDCLRPGKTPEMRAVEARVNLAICEALGMPPPGEGTERAVKDADDVALYYEALLWQPGAIDWAPSLASRPEGVCTLEDDLAQIMPRPGEDWRAAVEAELSSGE